MNLVLSIDFYYLFDCKFTLLLKNRCVMAGKICPKTGKNHFFNVLRQKNKPGILVPGLIIYR